VAAVLITGTSGFVGSRLAAALAPTHRVIGLSRQQVAIDGVTSVRGDFADPRSLSDLDDHQVDILIHLAGVTGAASEEDAMSVNVAGTRRLLRWAVDRGIRRIILASSIAAVGCLSGTFVPRQLPIPDDHPCDSSNVYGVSKAMIEQLADYFHRVTPDLEIVAFRIGAVLPVDAVPVGQVDLRSFRQPFCQLGAIEVDEVVRTFAAAIDKPLGPGVRRMNLVADQARSPLPTADAIRLLLGDRAAGLDLSYYETAGNEWKGIYAVDHVREAYCLGPV
jgi:UDP-glucose 4-epimerase